ncbi:hypothetical protein ACV35G_30745, partial [Pseudomonas aeruginosa]
EQLLGHGVLLLSIMLALGTTMLLWCFAQQAEQAACHSFFSLVAGHKNFSPPFRFYLCYLKSVI